MKKFTNAMIYRQHEHTSKILVDKGVIKRIGKNLDAIALHSMSPTY